METTPRKSRYLTPIIEQVWKDMGNYVGRDGHGKPEEQVIRYVDNHSSSYRPLSAVYNLKKSYRRPAAPVSVIINPMATDEEIRKKLVELQDRATKVKATVLSVEREHQRMDEERKVREKEEREAWVAMLRVAFGGDPEQELPADLAPKVITNHQLLEAGRQGYFQLRLPDDFPKRARLLATIDAALASDTK